MTHNTEMYISVIYTITNVVPCTISKHINVTEPTTVSNVASIPPNTNEIGNAVVLRLNGKNLISECIGRCLLCDVCYFFFSSFLSYSLYSPTFCFYDGQSVADEIKNETITNVEMDVFFFSSLVCVNVYMLGIENCRWMSQFDTKNQRHIDSLESNWRLNVLFM